MKLHVLSTIACSFFALAVSTAAVAGASYGAADSNCAAVLGNVADRICLFPSVPAGSTLEIQYVSWRCDVTEGLGIPVDRAVTLARMQTTPQNATSLLSYSLSPQQNTDANGAHLARSTGWSGASLWAKSGSAPRLSLKIISTNNIPLPTALNVSCSAALSGMLTP